MLKNPVFQRTPVTSYPGSFPLCLNIPFCSSDGSKSLAVVAGPRRIFSPEPFIQSGAQISNNMSIEQDKKKVKLSPA